MEAPSKKVLVAESDEIVLVLISHILSRYYTVQRCRDGADLETMLEGDDYDALLVDTRLLQGGLDHLRRLIQKDPTVPKKLIALTMRAEDRGSLPGIPVAAVLRKPVELYDLLETVRTVSSGA